MYQSIDGMQLMYTGEELLIYQVSLKLIHPVRPAYIILHVVQKVRGIIFHQLAILQGYNSSRV
jgi:hypothetical protein